MDDIGVTETEMLIAEELQRVGIAIKQKENEQAENEGETKQEESEGEEIA